jgi:hypothetical protein
MERGLGKEIERIQQKEQRNTIERYAEAMQDADELLESYRRIQRLLAQLAVNIIA